MIHRTFRSLDDAPKLVGFTIRQWAALIGGAIVVLAVVHIAQLPAKAAITLLVFTIGLPGALSYVSESGGLQLGALLRDVCRWRLRSKLLPAASPTDRCSHGVVIGPASIEGAKVRQAEGGAGTAREDPPFMEDWR